VITCSISTPIPESSTPNSEFSTRNSEFSTPKSEIGCSTQAKGCMGDLPAEKGPKQTEKKVGALKAKPPQNPCSNIHLAWGHTDHEKTAVYTVI